MQSDKKKLHYKIINALYANYHSKKPSPEEKEKRVAELKSYIETVRVKGLSYKDDAKTLSMIVGLTQKKVIEVCKEVEYKIYKEPDLSMFGVESTPDDIIEELLQADAEKLRTWVGDLIKTKTSTDYKALKDGKIEFVDESYSMENLEMSFLALNNPLNNDLRAHAIWYLQEVTRMIKSGEITSVCVVGKTKTGEAISYIPKFINESNRMKIINSFFDALGTGKTSITLN